MITFEHIKFVAFCLVLFLILYGFGQSYAGEPFWWENRKLTIDKIITTMLILFSLINNEPVVVYLFGIMLAIECATDLVEK